jgi:hypothetical protein
VPNDEPKEVPTLGAIERPHLVPSGNRGDRYDDPFDIASDALGLGIHGAVPLVGAPTFKATVNAWINLKDRSNPESGRSTQRFRESTGGGIDMCGFDILGARGLSERQHVVELGRLQDYCT